MFNKKGATEHWSKHEACLKTVFGDVSLSLITSISEDSDEKEIFEKDEDLAATEENFDRIPKATVSTDFTFSKLLSLVETNQAFSLDDVSLWKLASALREEIPISESLQDLDERRTIYHGRH